MFGIRGKLVKGLERLGETERRLESGVFFHPVNTVRDHIHFGQLVRTVRNYYQLTISTVDERDWTAMPLVQSEIAGFRAQLDIEAKQAKPEVREHFKALSQEVEVLQGLASRV